MSQKHVRMLSLSATFQHWKHIKNYKRFCNEIYEKKEINLKMDALVQFFILDDLEDEYFVRIRNRQLRDTTNIFDMPETEFLRNFRLNKDCFREIMKEIAPRMRSGYLTTIIPKTLRFATFLRFLASGSYQKCVGNSCLSTMSQTQVSRVISECLEIFEEYICPKWISLQMSAAQEIESKNHFFSRHNIPGVIGCVDGTHIKICSPGLQLRHLYYNRKGFYSINAMMICDEKMVIRYVDATHHGANHDAYVWRISEANSFLKSEYDNGKTNTWILGDAGYQLLPYLMTPFRNPLEEHRIAFNEKHSKARNIIERCFGVLKNRFRCLLGERGLHYKPQKVTKIVNACCALHNICLFYKNDWPALEIASHFVSDSEAIHIGNAATNVAVSIRERLELSLS